MAPSRRLYSVCTWRWTKDEWMVTVFPEKYGPLRSFCVVKNVFGIVESGASMIRYMSIINQVHFREQQGREAPFISLRQDFQINLNQPFFQNSLKIIRA